MSSGRGRSPCDTGPCELRLDVICPGTLAAASRRNDGSALVSLDASKCTERAPGEGGSTTSPRVHPDPAFQGIVPQGSRRDYGASVRPDRNLGASGNGAFRMVCVGSHRVDLAGTSAASGKLRRHWHTKGECDEHRT